MESENKTNEEKIVDFLYEVGSLRRIPRSHRQTLMVNDNADNIASHSFRVAIMGFIVAKMEGLDSHKVASMCLLHDLGEIRSGDHNWLHKRYVKVFEDEIVRDQLGDLPFSDLHDLASEYHKRETPEAVAAKDADLLDQILLLKEYEHQGNKEATIWLYGKDDDENHNKQLLMLKTESAKKLGKEIIRMSPSEWWKGVWTNQNR